MQFKLDKEQQKELDATISNNIVHKYFKNIENFNFEIGDVLLKSMKQWKGAWKHEQISYENKMPQRYVVVHKDEFNICWLKQLRVSDGSLGEKTYCILDYDIDHARFEVDPEYAEKVLLDANFDIKELHKQSLEGRKIISKMNKKKGVRPKTLKELNEFFNSLSPGDQFWTSRDYTGKYTQSCEFVKATQKSVVSLDQHNSWEWRKFKERFDHVKDGVNDTYALEVTFKETRRHGGGHESTYLNASFHKGLVYFKEAPAQEEEKK